MASFIFQASRRQLLAHLSRKLDAASSHRDQHLKRGEPENDIEERQIDNLLKAIRAADEQVKELEFWSDIKAMAIEGESAGAVSKEQGWGCRWDTRGAAGPPVSIANVRYTDRGKAARGRESQGPEAVDKGKGKA